MKLLMPSQVAQVLQVSRITVWKWTRAGIIKSLPSPTGRNRYTIEEVNRVARGMGLPPFKEKK